MPVQNEEAPLLSDTSTRTGILKKDKLSKLSIAAGLALFAGLVGSVLVRMPFNIFVFHPFFMTLFLILVTEGVNLLQPTSTPEEKRKGLKHHAMIQVTSYLSVVTGFSVIFYNKILQGKPHFESFHGKMGLFVFVYLFIQLVFGIAIAFVPRIFGSVEKAKSFYKYHRIFGYILLISVWITAQLGVRAHYMQIYLYSTHLMWLHWVAVILVFGGIISGIRVSKWGI